MRKAQTHQEKGLTTIVLAAFNSALGKLPQDVSDFMGDFWHHGKRFELSVADPRQTTADAPWAWCTPDGLKITVNPKAASLSTEELEFLIIYEIAFAYRVAKGIAQEVATDEGRADEQKAVDKQMEAWGLPQSTFQQIGAGIGRGEIAEERRRGFN
jgi:hypothetical protein